MQLTRGGACGYSDGTAIANVSVAPQYTPCVGVTVRWMQRRLKGSLLPEDRSTRVDAKRHTMRLYDSCGDGRGEGGGERFS